MIYCYGLGVSYLRIMEVKVLAAKTNKTICVLSDLSNQTTIGGLKKKFEIKFPGSYPDRQSFRSSSKGKSLKDEDLVKDACGNSGVIYYKDLGPQIAWSTVFYTEYGGPLLVYLLFYFRLPMIYGESFAYSKSNLAVVHLAAFCHSFHYAKRLLETKFIHRFSHGTMPIRNLFKNCTYYWTFTAWQAYLINHPLYTSPTYGNYQIYGALAVFIFCQLGNFSIHVALKGLRKPGTKERKIPYPTSNPFTLLFNFVSCPNYTYEVGSWLSFAMMTQSLSSLIFATLGFMQMSVWALGKHRNYKKEFPTYPKGRKAIVPLFI